MALCETGGGNVGGGGDNVLGEKIIYYCVHIMRKMKKTFQGLGFTFKVVFCEPNKIRWFYV